MVGLMTWVVMGSTRKKTREASSQLQMLNLVLTVCTCYNGWRPLTGTIGVQSCGDSASGLGNPLVMLFITTYLYILSYNYLLYYYILFYYYYIIICTYRFSGPPPQTFPKA